MAVKQAATAKQQPSKVVPIADASRLDALVIGAGPSGLSACIKLKEAGITNTVVLDRAKRIGGTWAMNDYPGLRCDIPSELYSLGYAPNPNWTRTYAPQAEIQQYLENVAHQFGIADRIRLNTEVTDARWDEDKLHWVITTEAGAVFEARVFVAAPGFFGEAAEPDFPGQSDFRGTIFHSAKWDHDHDLTGERVAVIGSGASAIQFLPAIQPNVKQIINLQRTPSWVLPKPDFPVPETISRLFAKAPVLQKSLREIGLMGLEVNLPVFMRESLTRLITHPIGHFNIRHSVKNRALRKKLTPAMTLGCKRPMFSNDWYSALAKPNVEVVFQALHHITETGIVTEDGTEYPVDTIIFGTGYSVAEPAINHIIKGRGGRSLADVWQGCPRAYQGLSIHGFPNMFLMLGPNSHSVQGSVMWTAEHQAVYIARGTRKLLSKRLGAFEVKDAVQKRFNQQIDKRLARMPIRPDVCRSYYLDAAGRNQFVWPEYGINIRRRWHHFDLADYDLTGQG